MKQFRIKIMKSKSPNIEKIKYMPQIKKWYGWQNISYKKFNCLDKAKYHIDHYIITTGKPKLEFIYIKSI